MWEESEKGEAHFQGSRLCEQNALLGCVCQVSLCLYHARSKYAPIQSLHVKDLIILPYSVRTRLAPGGSYRSFLSGISFRRGYVCSGCVLAFPPGWLWSAWNAIKFFWGLCSQITTCNDNPNRRNLL